MVPNLQTWYVNGTRRTYFGIYGESGYPDRSPGYANENTGLYVQDEFGTLLEMKWKDFIRLARAVLVSELTYYDPH